MQEKNALIAGDIQAIAAKERDNVADIIQVRFLEAKYHEMNRKLRYIEECMKVLIGEYTETEN